MQILFLLWLFISLIGTLFIILDKYNAIHRKKRISENTLILTAALGAALFMWITMYLMHHKTRHIKFTVGLPLIIIIHAFLFIIGLHLL